MAERIRIRPTTKEDLSELAKVYEYARGQMRANGNPTQWGTDRPAPSLLVGDVVNKTGFVMEEKGEIVGAFAFIIGEDPTYLEIEGGEWLNQEPYGTIHRIASNGKCKGIFEACIAFCEKQVSNLRVDTHADNHIMQHLAEKNGFTKCGIIYVDDGTPRIAYHKIITGR